MYRSKYYYSGQEIDERLLQGYYDDLVKAGYTGTKEDFYNLIINLKNTLDTLKSTDTDIVKDIKDIKDRLTKIENYNIPKLDFNQAIFAKNFEQILEGIQNFICLTLEGLKDEGLIFKTSHLDFENTHTSFEYLDSQQQLQKEDTYTSYVVKPNYNNSKELIIPRDYLLNEENPGDIYPVQDIVGQQHMLEKNITFTVPSIKESYINSLGNSTTTSTEPSSRKSPIPRFTINTSGVKVNNLKEKENDPFSWLT